MNELSIMSAMPQPKVYNGQRVVTLRDIDELHQRKDGTAWQNFNSNRGHFVEGLDFYHVIRDNQQNLKFSGFEIGKRGTLVFTLTGYLMIVKSFTDDLSWAIQRELVNGYFAGRKIGNTFLGTPVITVREYCEKTGECADTVRRRLKEHYAQFPLGSALYLEGYNLALFKKENPQEGRATRALWIMTQAAAELLARQRSIKGK